MAKFKTCVDEKVPVFIGSAMRGWLDELRAEPDAGTLLVVLSTGERFRSTQGKLTVDAGGISVRLLVRTTEEVT